MSDDTEKRTSTSGRVSIIAAAIACLAAVASALVPAVFTYTSRDRELNIRLVEIGIGILRDDPEKSGVRAARRWAIEIIQTNSGKNFTQEERHELETKALPYYPADWGGSDGWGTINGTTSKPVRLPR